MATYHLIFQQIFLTKWISDNEWPSFFNKMVLMFQKEVADRIHCKS